MAIKINFDTSNNIETPTLVLAHRNGDKIGILNTVESDIHFSDSMNDKMEFSFTLHKKLNNHPCAIWNQVKDFKLVWIKEYDEWFDISVGVNEDESGEIYKIISAVSLGESELSQIMLDSIEINTEIDISRDSYVTPTVLYNLAEPSISLLDRLLEKAPHYSVAYVDDSIADIQRTFSFSNKSIRDAFLEISEEINCLFIFNSNTNKQGKIARTVSVYDLESNCVNCGHREEFTDRCPKCGSSNITTGYGKDTTIFISTDNLADNIIYSVDVDSVKNCFRLEAGDDLMTSVISSCNPNGSNYIWYFSDEIKEDMSDELRKKIDDYNYLYKHYQSDYLMDIDSVILSGYNSLISKYKIYNEDFEEIDSPIMGYPRLINAYFNTIDLALFLESSLMPDANMQETNAQEQGDLLITANLSPVAVTDVSDISLSTANSAVLAMAKIIVDSRYQVKINESGLASQTWTGSFIITNYSNNEDTYITTPIVVQINDDYEFYVNQKIQKTINKEVSNTSISGLFKRNLDDFIAELKKYSLTSLNSFSDSCQACINLLIEQGIADSNTWADNEPNLYDSLYIPYYNKLTAIQSEILLRESEITLITGKYDFSGELVEYGFQNLIEEIKSNIQDTLNFENYLGNELWLEFCAYRREDEYKNSNYVSDGLNNSELFKNAFEFIEVANKEIYKSSTLQHSISSSLKNLLVMKEFHAIVDYFEVGNWIRIYVDGDIYRLRLLKYEINYNDPDDIDVVFSDVIKSRTGISDAKSVIDQASSMATSYDAIIRQSNKGYATSNTVNDWLKNGLDVTNAKIINNISTQDVVWDSGGILCREYNDVLGKYSDEQLKIINKGLYVTDDNWKTARSGIGNFIYFDPKDKIYKDGYGVIADTICSNLILSKEVGIYNKEGSIQIGDDGVVITTSADSIKKNLFTIQKSDEDNNYVKQMYIDSDGNITMNDLLAKNITIDGMTAKRVSFNEYIHITQEVNIPGYEKEFIYPAITMTYDGVDIESMTIALFGYPYYEKGIRYKPFENEMRIGGDSQSSATDNGSKIYLSGSDNYGGVNVEGKLTITGADVYSQKNINIGYKTDDAAGLYFYNAGAGTYKHQCRIYRGSATDTAGLGMYDGLNGNTVWYYNDQIKTFNFNNAVPVIVNGKLTVSTSAENNVPYTNLDNGRVSRLRMCTISGTESSSNYLEVQNPATQTWGITAWASDARLKENIEICSGSALNLINQILVRSLDFKEGIHRHRDYALVAQEVKEVLPEAIFEVDQTDVDGNVLDTVMQLKEQEFIPIIIKALQELVYRVSKLENHDEKMQFKEVFDEVPNEILNLSLQEIKKG